jgi:hypothetical protein
VGRSRLDGHLVNFMQDEISASFPFGITGIANIAPVLPAPGTALLGAKICCDAEGYI